MAINIFIVMGVLIIVTVMTTVKGILLRFEIWRDPELDRKIVLVRLGKNFHDAVISFNSRIGMQGLPIYQLADNEREQTFSPILLQIIEN